MNVGRLRRRSLPGQGALLVIALCVALLFQGSRGLYETTEGRYAEVAREMVATGDWMTPRLDGQPHWSKPPLTYWSIAACLEVGGRNTWSARIPGAIAFLVAVVAVSSLGAALWDEATGVVAGIVFATSPFVVAGENVVSPDMLLACWEIVAVGCWWRAVRAREGRSQRGWVTGMWAMFGLAFLTKGPPGLLPLAAILAFVMIERRRGDRTPRLAQPAGVLLFVLLAFGWYALVVSHDHALAGYLLGEEVWGRVATGMHHRNARWYMPAVVFGLPLLVGGGAWLITSIIDAWRFSARSRWRDTVHGREAGFLLLWFALPLVVFCISKSRLPLYVLPLGAPLALGAARLAVRACGEAGALRRAAWVGIVSATLLVAAKGVSARMHSREDMRPLAEAARATNADRITVIDETALYGLEFYLDGSLHRMTGRELGAELDAARSRLNATPGRSELLLSRRGEPASLGRACRSSLTCTASSSGRYQLWLLRAH